MIKAIARPLFRASCTCCSCLQVISHFSVDFRHITHVLCFQFKQCVLCPHYRLTCIFTLHAFLFESSIRLVGHDYVSVKLKPLRFETLLFSFQTRSQGFYVDLWRYESPIEFSLVDFLSSSVVVLSFWMRHSPFDLTQIDAKRSSHYSVQYCDSEWPVSPDCRVPSPSEINPGVPATSPSATFLFARSQLGSCWRKCSWLAVAPYLPEDWRSLRYKKHVVVLSLRIRRISFT